MSHLPPGPSTSQSRKEAVTTVCQSELGISTAWQVSGVGLERRQGKCGFLWLPNGWKNDLNEEDDRGDGYLLLAWLVLEMSRPQGRSPGSPNETQICTWEVTTFYQGNLHFRRQQETDRGLGSFRAGAFLGRGRPIRRRKTSSARVWTSHRSTPLNLLKTGSAKFYGLYLKLKNERHTLNTHLSSP
jgi:hypothetical protein